MDLAGQLDPEQWHTILDRFFAILSEGVHRFEGTVNQYTGDGIMALFGAPLAHEDHAQRACMAALYLRNALRSYADVLRRTRGISFDTRMGLNSGEVVVGAIGADLRMDYTAQGHTVGLAQRMEQLAEQGTAYMTAHTARLVEGYFSLRALGEFELKGATAPLAVFALEGLGTVRTRLDLSQSRGFSKFVGRAQEVATLEAAFEQSLQVQGRTVGVVAEAGTGKSRLCFEFLERCRARGFAVVEARGEAHGRHVPLLPMLELLRAYFGIQRNDDDQTVQAKIAGRLLLLDDSLRDDLPIFFNLLGVPDPARPLPAIDADTMQRRTYAALRAIVRADGQREKPAIVYFEDLHWLDAASDGYLAQIIEATATTRGLVLLNFRPEYRAAWMQLPHYQQLPLVPLGAGAVRELLDDMFGGDDTVKGLADFVHQRAGGNPFFIEEIVQNLIETKAMVGSRGAYCLVQSVEALTLPATVQNLLAARIDRLPEQEKRLLQQAAVIGKTFQAQVLMRITDVPAADFDSTLHALCSAQFLHEAALYPEVEYTFKHPLTQEVAERSQLQVTRTQTHAAVARVMTDLAAGRLDEVAALLAHHWAAAGESHTAATWHARAARWIGLANHADAFTHWRQVVELIADSDDAEDALRLRGEALQNLLVLAFRVHTSQQDISAWFDAGQRTFARLGDEVGRGAVLLAYGFNRQNAGDSDQFSALAAEAYAIGQRTGDRDLIAGAGGEYAFACLLKGRLTEVCTLALSVRAHCAGNLQLGIPMTGYSAAVGCDIYESLALATRGQIAVAETVVVEAVKLARHDVPPETLAWAQLYLILVLDARGGPADVAMRSAREVMAAADHAANDLAYLTANYALALAHLLDEQWSSVVEASSVAIALWREHQLLGDQAPAMLVIRARGLLGTGAFASALEDCAEAINRARSQRQPAHLCEALIVEARGLRLGPWS